MEAAEQRERLQVTLRSIGDAVISTDPSGRVSYLNLAAERLMGWASDEAAGRPLEEVFRVVHEQTRQSVENPVTRVLREGRIVGLANHTLLISRNGREIPIDDSAAPITNDSGEVLGVVLVFRDVTDRRAAEKAVAESLARFRTMGDHAPVLIWMTDQEGLYNWFNRPWLDFTGRRLDQEAGHSWEANIHPEDRERRVSLYTKAFESKQSFQAEFRLCRQDGVYRWLLDHGTPLFDSTGAFSGYIGSCIDITEHKETEQQLVQLQDQLALELAAMRRLHELGQRLMALEDESALLNEILTAARSITGADMGNIQLLGDDGLLRIQVQHGFSRKFLDFFSSVQAGDAATCGVALVNRVRVVVEDLENSSIFAGTPALRVLREEGVRAVQSTPLVTRADVLVGILSTHYGAPRTFSERDLRLIDLLARHAADLMENLRAGEALREVNRNLARANEDLSQFAYAASHDLQEPLRMITAFSELLIQKYEGNLSADAALYVEYITEGTTRMRELLADLLAYTRLGGSGTPPAGLVDMNAAFEKAVANLKTAIEETQAEVTSGPLPSISGSEAHFVQLLQNLISNSLKYKSESQPRVHISAQEQNGAWRMAVEDNGIGIDPHYHKQIFGIFKRLHGRDLPGTGMGLAICQRVVERYGGRIWVDSQVGSGSIFYFTLPSLTLEEK
jgi:PAS domain S-box-containing protein